ncbi:interleukin-1 receptor accessory protein [Erpetoichthys calabaricus]|uniref:interleukin-1 receptor accessory protein n=1 Tax=Erpetoichthys calabaricus TaxID=27687 RepID=UPI002233E926|nr:interleukin-1 receptor accessory protein [Erpetoichthys calabaricus]
MVLNPWLFILCNTAAIFSFSGTSPSSENHQSDSCYDWGVYDAKSLQIYDGELGKLTCPLFSEARYNYSTSLASGLSLLWYWIRQGQDLEEPIDFRLPDNRILKERDVVWFQPSTVNDSGLYICMLRNSTFCQRVAVPLSVLQKDPSSCVSSKMKHNKMMIPLETKGDLHCPDIEGYYPPSLQPSIRWYKDCQPLKDKSFEKEVIGDRIVIYIMRKDYAGNYTCIVNYTLHNRSHVLTRTTTVRVVGMPSKRKPVIHHPNKDQEVVKVSLGDTAELLCHVYFPFLMNSPTEAWWTVDGKKLEPFTTERYQLSSSFESTELDDRTIKILLKIMHFTEEDLKHNYVCFSKNNEGEVSSQAFLKLRVTYTMELACGLGITLFIVVSLVIVYHVYWLELVLLYRANFGTDEANTDGKEYDVYISYARNAEEEEFVLLTLRAVLENEFGYKVCIFDRDSLPGGTITDETLNFIKKSRRIIVLLSPNYLLQGTQELLELKAGISNMALTGSIRVVLVQYKAVKNTSAVKELKRACSALTVIKWRGEKASDLNCKFWKQIHVALPVKRDLRPKASCEKLLS